MIFQAIHKLPLEGGGGARKTLVPVRSKSFSLPQRNALGLILQGLFEGMQSCKSLGLTRGTKGEGLKGGLSALCNAIKNAACCMLVVPRPSIKGHTSQKCPPSGGGLHPRLLNNTTRVFAQPTLTHSRPIACIPFPSPVKITMQAKIGFKRGQCPPPPRSPFD